MSKESWHNHPVLIPIGKPKLLSLPCATGSPDHVDADHARCTGRMRVKSAIGKGQRYATCQCPVCKHPRPAILRTNLSEEKAAEPEGKRALASAEA